MARTVDPATKGLTVTDPFVLGRAAAAVKSRRRGWEITLRNQRRIVESAH